MASVRARVVAGVVLAASSLVVALPATATSQPGSTVPPSTVLENPFLPDDTTVDLTDCISALPRPECASEERDDWRQGVLFGVVVAGLVAIGARVAVGIRRRDRPT
jgi:hypothetical protein